MEQLKEKLIQYVPHDPESYLYSVYDLWTRKPIKTDDDVAALRSKTELEVIFVVHQDWRSLNLLAEVLE